MAEKEPAKNCEQKDFFKPYGIKPAEVYVEPNPDICAGEKKK
ncbi:hypothetical protein [Desulfallas sp. Bu1-1]|nr:hypothetical protein [Desulfallas sp. Bu1-1]